MQKTILSNTPVIAHMIPQYLGHTLNWVYTQIKYMPDFEHYVITDRIMNRESYPISNIYAPRIPSDSNKLSWWAERLFRRCGWPPIQDYLCFSNALKKNRPSCIFAHFGKDGYFALRFKRKFNLPLITRFYGYDIGILPQFPLWRKRYIELFEQGDGFIVEGENMKKLLMKYGCIEDKIHVNHLGIETNHIIYKERIAQPGKLRVLISGNFKEKKGIEYAIKALGILNKENSDLKLLITIIGDGVLKSHLHNCAQECGIDDLIEWTGYQPHEEFIRRLYENDIFCSPSVIAKDGDTEGGAPVSIIEAGASGLPTVSTFHADIPDIVVNNVTGILVPERNEMELFYAILAILNNHEKRLEYGMQGRNHIVKNYNAKVQGCQLANILKPYLV